MIALCSLIASMERCIGLSRLHEVLLCLKSFKQMSYKHSQVLGSPSDINMGNLKKLKHVLGNFPFDDNWNNMT